MVAREGYEFLGMSPLGDRLLARRDASLVLLDLEGREIDLLTEHLLNASLPAVWIPETEQVAYLEDVEGDRLHIFDLRAGSAKSQPGTRTAQSLLPPSGPRTIVWLGEACEPADSCRKAWWLDPATGGQNPLTGWLRPIPDPAGKYVAYLYADDSGKNRLALAPMDRSREVRPGVPGDNILDYLWSPDGAQLLVVALVRSDYSGRWFGSRQFLITPATWDISELPQTNTANALGLWSPDGRQVVVAGTEPDDGGYDVTLRRIDLMTRKVETLAPGVDLSSPNFVFVTQMAWRPLR
jgi:Tol biopolymer transport system component